MRGDKTPNDDDFKDAVSRYISNKQNNVNNQSPDYKSDENKVDYHDQFKDSGKNLNSLNVNNILNSPDFQDIFLKSPHKPNIKSPIKEQKYNGENVEAKEQEYHKKPTVERIQEPEPVQREQRQEEKRQEEKRIPFQNVYSQPPSKDVFNTRNTYFQEEDIRQTPPKRNYQEPKQSNYRNNEASFFYREIDINSLPYGIFYHPNTRIQLRPVELLEIQHIATLDNETVMEARNKLDELLNNCLHIILPDGTQGNIDDVKEGDRFYLILLLREITFQEGPMISVSTQCSCGSNLKIELVRHHLEYIDINKEIEPFWDPYNNCFVLETTLKRNPIYLAPPSIGIQSSFIEWAQFRVKRKLPINESFYKIIPFTKVNRNYMTIDEIEQELYQFENNLSRELFMYLEEVVTKYMKFGIKGLVKKCSCGREVRTNKVFPRRAKDLILVPGSFDKFTKKRSQIL